MANTKLPMGRIKFFMLLKTSFAVLILFGFATIYYIPTERYLRSRSSLLSKYMWLYPDDGAVCQAKHNIAFLKNHKCGSSAIQNMLFRYGYNNNWKFAVPSLGNYFGAPIPFHSSMVPHFNSSNRPNIFALHTKWNKEQITALMPNDTIFFTIVREPTEQFESLFTYAKFSNKTGLTLDEYVDKVTNDSKRLMGYLGYNQMTWDFGLPADKFKDYSTFKMMLKEWDKHFSLVMVAERMEESLVLLRHLLCWDYTDVIVLVTNTRREEFRTHINPKTRLKLQQRQYFDYILYDHFTAKHAMMVEEFGEEKMLAEIQSLRNAKKSLEKKCNFTKVASTNITGANKPWSPQVFGYQSNNSTDKDCTLISKSEHYFITKIREKQNRQLNGNLIPGSIRLDDIIKKYKSIDLINSLNRSSQLRP